MVALARTCQQYGRFRDARQLLEAAGAHGELLALCVFQGDFPGLQAHARQVRAAPPAAALVLLWYALLWCAEPDCCIEFVALLIRCRRGAMWSGWRTS